MSHITRTFTYKIPDDYVSQTNVNDSSASFTYRGPHFLNINFNKNTGSVTSVSESTFEDYLNRTAEEVIVSADDNLLIASILWGKLGEDSSDNDYPQKIINLPDGDDNHTYQYPWPPLPWKAYDAEDVRYDAVSNTFNTPRWHQPWSNWTMIGAQCENIKKRCDEKIAEYQANEDSSWTAEIAAWTAYKDEADNKIQLYMSNGLEPHHVVFTRSPEYVEPALDEVDSADSAV